MSKDIERTNFIGTSVPREVKICIKHIQNITTDKFNDLIEVVTKHFTDVKSAEELFEKCLEKYDDNISEIYPGLLMIVQCALRLPSYSLSEKDFIKDLNQLNVPKQFHGDLQKLIFGEIRKEIDEIIQQRRPRYPTLEGCRWRLDVAISTSSLCRVLEPSILMEIQSTGGSSNTFEISKEKFHELRHAVSYVLKQMQQLEKRSVLQIKS